MQLHSNDTTEVTRVQPLAASPLPQPTLRQSTCICNVSKTIVTHNANDTIHLSVMEEKIIYDMMNVNAVHDPTSGYLLELRQLLKTPKAKLCKYGSFNEFARLSQGNKNQTVKGTKTIHIISPKQEPSNKKAPYA